MVLSDYESNVGECVGVDFRESEQVDVLYSLSGYHPKKCEIDINLKYLATTSIPSGRNYILMDVNPVWGSNLIQLIHSLKFKINGSMLLADLPTPKPRAGTGNIWELHQWTMEKKQMQDCKGKPVTVIHDTLTWKNYQSRQGLDDITTTWTWIYN